MYRSEINTLKKCVKLVIDKKHQPTLLEKKFRELTVVNDHTSNVTVKVVVDHSSNKIIKITQ